MSFDFLGYALRPRDTIGKNGRFTGFDLAVDRRPSREPRAQEPCPRQRNPANRRELVITLTAAGRRLLVRHASEIATLEDRMTSALGSRDVEAFRSYLDACRVALAQV